MRDEILLQSLLESETEEDVIRILEHRELLKPQNRHRWKYLGNMPNNQSIVLNQQSTAAAAQVEKFTNGADAILLGHCKAMGIDPRGVDAPQTMAKAVEAFLGDLSEKTRPEIREFAEDNLLLYATGKKDRPSLSLYDAGEGQFAEDFPSTFCSLIYGDQTGAYKGAIPFVQGRFNMGGTGVLPFCSEKYELQLILSRRPSNVAKRDDHEWAFTLFCFFASKQNPSWCYLVGEDEKILTTGSTPLALLPKKGVKTSEIAKPRERKVSSGTLIKMYDFKAPKSNICGELYKKLGEFLLRPSLPLHIVECRESYLARVMAVTVWDRFDRWEHTGKLEEDFEQGSSVFITLSTGETVPGEVRVFKSDDALDDDDDQPQTGVRALINGQSHARRGAEFFRTKEVDKEHIAGSILVTMDCTGLGQDSRNALFMSDRERFRDDTLLQELFKKLRKELREHQGLIDLNKKRYAEKVKHAVDDEDGIKALEELLSTDPTLADLFGSVTAGKVAAPTATDGAGGTIHGPFIGLEFPTYFRRRNGSLEADIGIPRGDSVRASFLTDVKSNYFTRRRPAPGTCTFTGDLQPTYSLFNGRLAFTCLADKTLPEGTKMKTTVEITDKNGSGPFVLTLNAQVLPPREKRKNEGNGKEHGEPLVQAGPSRPNIKEVDNKPDDPPLTIGRNPDTGRLELLLNRKSHLLDQAKKLRPKEEEPAVEFVFKYGLALTAMGLLDTAQKTDEWKTDDAGCRKTIEHTALGIARVIVPLCLSLPKKLPKTK
ncbi:hypothetical protein [Candidatus Binatus soli]|jgi:hypothetical protein|uniref:hypothetical protein n=1 Tax=Candidatus Binatus soli TaxID=1953413 RepID=UPI003D14DA4F